MGLEQIDSWSVKKRLLALVALVLLTITASFTSFSVSLGIPSLGIQLPSIALSLRWTILTIMFLFLAFQVCAVWVIKTWFPDLADEVTTTVWRSIMVWVWNQFSSCFKLIFGDIFQYNAFLSNKRSHSSQHHHHRERKDRSRVQFQCPPQSRSTYQFDDNNNYAFNSRSAMKKSTHREH